MEDIIQRIFAIVFTVLVFFVMPIYMTFEKKDDISYALALKITTNFVDQVTQKGYMTLDMYNDFVSELSVTNNSYDIKLEHVAKKYNPVINVYSKEDEKLVDTLDYNIYRGIIEQRDKVDSIKSGGNTYTTQKNTFEVTYKLNEEIFNEQQILKFFEQKASNKYLNMSVESYNKITREVDYTNSIQEKIPYLTVRYIKDNLPVYTMSVGDEFAVILKNTNKTIATVFFDMLTFGGSSGSNSRIYINYGGTIKNEEYRDFK